MRKIGLIGGMSWQSTALYYQWINEGVANKLGGLHSADILLVSVDFHHIANMQRQAQWDMAGQLLAQQALTLQQAGADFILLLTNTMHKIAQYIEQAIEIPFIHLADMTAIELLRQGCSSAGLLGTQFTMEDSFYRDRLEQKYGIEVKVPNRAEREQIHRIIYDELCKGEVKEPSKEIYVEIVKHLQSIPVDCIIAGCTEITMLIKQEDCTLPLFDTTFIHANKAVELALSECNLELPGEIVA